MLIPPNNSELSATGLVAVLVSPNPQAERRQYSEPTSGHRLRDFQAGDPLGKSLGITSPGTDGKIYLMIEMYRWVSDGFFGHAREFAKAYILLADAGRTWTWDGVGSGPDAPTPSPIITPAPQPGPVPGPIPGPIVRPPTPVNQPTPTPAPAGLLKNKRVLYLAGGVGVVLLGLLGWWLSRKKAAPVGPLPLPTNR